jgi:hypothetical protein
VDSAGLPPTSDDTPMTQRRFDLAQTIFIVCGRRKGVGPSRPDQNAGCPQEGRFHAAILNPHNGHGSECSRRCRT